MVVARIYVLVTSEGLDVLPTWIVASHMVLLPKKTYSLLPSGLGLYNSWSLRPLSPSITFIKLVSSSLKIALCCIVDSRLHLAQRCFEGRNILDNVIAIETSMHKLAIEFPNISGTILFDMCAALPSLAQHFLFRILAFGGLPL